MLTLTASARQARYLRDRWAEQQLAAGQQAWETPPILSLQAWLRQQWEWLLQQGEALPLLLSPEQERCVWQQCQPEGLNAAALLRAEGLLDQAMRAWRRYHQWCHEEESLQRLLASTHLEEMELFFQWQQALHAQCQQEAWITQAELTVQLSQLFTEGRLQPPQQLHCYQREQFSYAEEQLLQQLVQQGCAINEVPWEWPIAEHPQWSYEDPQQERAGMVAALKQQLQQQPETRAAIVVPQLAAERPLLEQLLSEQLVPESAVTPVDRSRLPFRFSQGASAIEDERIYYALQLLQLKQKGLPFLEVMALLRAPWWLQGEEWQACARLEAALRSELGVEVTLNILVQQVERQQQSITTPRFLGALTALQALEWGAERSMESWAQQWTRALSYFEWAENGNLNEQARYAYDGWREGLDRFVSLAPQLEKLDAAAALKAFRQLLSGVELEQGRSSRAVEILTPEEAKGVRFDWLWIMGCDDRAWPQQRPLSPFLPQQWQRDRVPEVSHEWAQRSSRAQLQQLAQSGAQVYFSCSLSEAEGEEPVLSFTPLLSGPPLMVEPVAQSDAQWWEEKEAAALAPMDEQLSPLAWGSVVRGGSSLLMNQSHCPFRAFVRHRLEAVPLEEEPTGLDPRARGILLHQLLERCWLALEEQSSQLQQLDDRALRALVYKIAGGVVEQYRHAHQQRLGVQFASNEQQRLTEQVTQMLQLDRQRSAAFHVVEQEQQHQIELGGLQLSVKIDRVDQLEDGRKVVIDYKSGAVSRSEWSGERPTAPQLPLYALLLEQVAAVLYGQVRADEVGYQGEQMDAAVMEGAVKGKRVVVNEAWAQQLQLWRSALTSLAEEFRQGVVDVAPLYGPASCQYCGLQPLCRVEHEG